jgi:hypothetical protein
LEWVTPWRIALAEFLNGGGFIPSTQPKRP